MIYYFSGTGNSAWIAGELARLTDDAAVYIPDLLRGDVASAGRNDRIGLVFPVYAWRAPVLVSDFCKTLAIPAGAFCYAVCTCGDEAGRAMAHLRPVFPWQSAYSLAMPNNYLPLVDVDAPAVVREKIAAARARLPEIAAEIQSARPVCAVHAGSMAGLKSGLIAPLFQRFACSTAPFSAGERCTGCGLCAASCPVAAIRLSDGRPVWEKPACAQCQRCIHHCPVRAIEYGKATKTRGRYHFPGADDPTS